MKTKIIRVGKFNRFESHLPIPFGIHRAVGGGHPAQYALSACFNDQGCFPGGCWLALPTIRFGSFWLPTRLHFLGVGKGKG